MALPENADRRFELAEGEIVEKMPTQEHGIIAGKIITELNLCLRQNPIGRAAGEARYRREGDAHNDRLLDVSFVVDLSRPIVCQGAMNALPDLANGSRMMWLVYPEKRLIEVLTLADRQLLNESDILAGGEVLPGFNVPVRTLLAD